MSDGKVNLVVFDLGRILIRLWDGWEPTCAELGIVLSDPRRELDAQALKAIDEAAARLDTGAIDLERFAREVAPHRGLDARDVVRLINAVLREPYFGAERLIDDLHRAGIETACLSNTSEPHWSMMLDRNGPHALPLERLTHRFASHLLGLRKPDSRIYEHVERTTGRTAGQIVFFDDLADNITAAQKRAWRGIHIAPCENPVPAMRRHLDKLLGESWTAA